MDLITYYQNLVNPKKELREKIKEACGCNDATVFRYLNGTITPNKLTREAIAKALNMDVKVLFPECESKE